MSHHSNPPHAVKISLPVKMAQECLPLLLVLIDSGNASYDPHVPIMFGTPDQITLHPPKGTTDNRLWAERVCENALKHNLPALVVRPTTVFNDETYSPERKELK